MSEVALYCTSLTRRHTLPFAAARRPVRTDHDIEGRGSERKHGLSTEQVPVSAYVGSSKNIKDLKDPPSRAVSEQPSPTPSPPAE
jgi:hypothetical protein